MIRKAKCQACAGWGDHPDCDCEYDPAAVIAGGQCPWCDVGDKCEAKENGYTCPYSQDTKKSAQAFSIAWSIVKQGP